MVNNCNKFVMFKYDFSEECYFVVVVVINYVIIVVIFFYSNMVFGVFL